MSETSLPVRHLFKITLTTEGAPTMLTGAPQGTRMLIGVGGGKFEGERLRGEAVAPGGDWVTQRQDGSIKLDVRLTLLTDDGAAILVTYNGIGTFDDGNLKARSAPLFETGDERYTWLNNVQGVGIGGLSGTDVNFVHTCFGFPNRLDWRGSFPIQTVSFISCKRTPFPRCPW